VPSSSHGPQDEHGQDDRPGVPRGGGLLGEGEAAEPRGLAEVARGGRQEGCPAGRLAGGA